MSGNKDDKSLPAKLNIFAHIYRLFYGNKSLDSKRKISGWLMLLPVLPAFLLVIIFPAVMGIIQSFTDAGIAAMAAGIGSEFFEIVNFTGISNYIELFTDAEFWEITFRTFLLVFLAVFLQYVSGLVLALLLDEELKGFRWFKNVVMLPWVVPVASMVVIFNWMTAPNYGVVNMLLESAGMEHLTTNWFGSITFAFPIIIIMHVWRNMPFYALTLFAGLSAIPQIQYEAAEVDGASAWQKFRHITLPNLKYPSMVVIVLHVLWTFNNFDIIYLSTGGGPVGTTEVLATEVYDLAWDLNLMGQAAAMGVIMMLVMMLFSGLYMKLVGGDV